MGLIEGVQLAVFGRILRAVGLEGLLHNGSTMEVAHIAVDCCGKVWAHSHALEYVGIDIVVNENYSAVGSLEEGLDEDVGTEHLSIEEDTKSLFEAAVIEAVEDLVYLLIGGELLEFYSLKSLEDGCIGNDELTHGMEGIVDADGHLNGNVGTKDG